MRRPFAQLAVTVLLLAASVLVPASAQAQPSAQAVAGSCPHPQPYPPGPNATVQSSATNVHSGETIKVSGIRYCPDVDVTITIHGRLVATGHTNSAGSFGPDAAVVPAEQTTAQLCGTGASGLAGDRDCLTLHFRGVAGVAAARAPGANAGANGGGTAFTGVEIAALIAVAAALLSVGIAFSTAGRRRTAARG